MTLAELQADSSFIRHEPLPLDPNAIPWIAFATKFLQNPPRSLHPSERESLSIGFRSTSPYALLILRKIPSV